MGREFTDWRDCIGRVRGGGSSGWMERVVVVPGGWEWEKTQHQKHVNSLPNGRSLTSDDLSNIESGGPQAANINFVGWKL